MSVTQLESFFLKRESMGQDEEEVYELIKASPAGLTDAEIVDLWGKPVNCVTGRRRKLVQKGWIRNSERTAYNAITKRYVTVWESV